LQSVSVDNDDADALALLCGIDRTYMISQQHAAEPFHSIAVELDVTETQLQPLKLAQNPIHLKPVVSSSAVHCIGNAYGIFGCSHCAVKQMTV